MGDQPSLLPDDFLEDWLASLSHGTQDAARQVASALKEQSTEQLHQAIDDHLAAAAAYRQHNEFLDIELAKKLAALVSRHGFTVKRAWAEGQSAFVEAGST